MAPLRSGSMPANVVPFGTQGDQHIAFGDNTIEVSHPDGSVTVDFNADEPKEESTTDFDANLALKMESGELSTIAND